MMRRVIFMILVLGILACAASVPAQNSQRAITVVLEQPDRQFTEFGLISQLYSRLTMQAGLRVIVPGEDSAMPAAPDRRFDLDRLLEWGREVQSRYIIYLQIDDRDIVTRKRTSIPYILSRYIVEGQVNGSYCLIDLNRNKVVGTWELKTRLPGPRQWQVAEDYPDDPDLHVSAPKKIAFMKKLEDRAALEIIEQIRLHLKGR